MADKAAAISGPESKKRKFGEIDDSLALVPVSTTTQEPGSSSSTANKLISELVAREQKRLTLELNPLYLRTLRDRKEIGFRRPAGKKKLPLLTFEIDLPVLQAAMTDVMKQVLLLRYHSQASMRASEIDAEIAEIVPLVIDVCMSALYAKLRNIHKSYGKHSSRYTSAPTYTKEIEIPLPFALAIQEFGSFETHSMIDNYVLAPTYAEGVQNEGRKVQPFVLTEYQSYVPTLKDLKIPCKSVDPRVKLGSAWWTYKAETVNSTTDFVCTLPNSHYSDLSALLRTIFMSPGSDGNAPDIMKFPPEIPDYGTRLREMRPISAVSAFMALCHGDDTEWSFGPN